MKQAERDDTLFEEIVDALQDGDDISISLIQRRFKTGYNLASGVFNKLLEAEFIELPDNHPLGVSKFYKNI